MVFHNDVDTILAHPFLEMCDHVAKLFSLYGLSVYVNSPEYICPHLQTLYYALAPSHRQ